MINGQLVAVMVDSGKLSWEKWRLSCLIRVTDDRWLIKIMANDIVKNDFSDE